MFRSFSELTVRIFADGGEKAAIEQLCQRSIHCLHSRTSLRSPCHIGLIGDDDIQEPRSPGSRERLGDPRKYFQLVRRCWRIRPAIADNSAVYHAVPIEQKGPAARHRTDSHLVWSRLSNGCETNRCHRTA